MSTSISYLEQRYNPRTSIQCDVEIHVAFTLIVKTYFCTFVGSELR